MHRPSAVMSTANDNIVIVEKEMIHLTTADGRWIQTITDRSIKKLYGVLRKIQRKFHRFRSMFRYCVVSRPVFINIRFEINRRIRR